MCWAHPQGSALPASQISASRPVSAQDVQKVHYAIEVCLMRCLSQAETVVCLQRQGVQPAFTRIVWQKLEEQNPSFFKEYSAKLQAAEGVGQLNLHSTPSTGVLV
ncbi:hypothetical protein WJX72_003573 [[Myrmecia] bisecta]|uniref:Uncharacterized protein n=1 Tax=[Myrmecia] bisecta TaxID=41462 RepID=A0AAW1PY14_9CHLO